MISTYKPPVQRAFTNRLAGMPYDPEPLPVPKEPVALPNETATLVSEPLPAPTEPAPEPSESRINTGDSASSKNKGGRPRTHPAGTTAAQRMQTIRAQHKKDAEIKRTEQQQKIDDRSDKVSGRGSESIVASTGHSNLDRLAGWSHLANVWGERTPLDNCTLEQFETKLSEVFASNPSLAASFGNMSVMDIFYGLEDHISGNYYDPRIPVTSGHRVQPEGTGATSDPENIAAYLIEKHFSPEQFPNFSDVVKLSQPERAKADETVGKLRHDPRFMIWVTPEEGLGHFQCVLCKHDVLTSLALIKVHFVDKHLKELRKFFKDHGVPLRKDYLRF